MRNMLDYNEISAHFRTLAASASMMTDAFESLAKDFSKFDDGPEHDPNIREHLKESYRRAPKDFLKYVMCEPLHIVIPEPEEEEDD